MTQQKPHQYGSVFDVAWAQAAFWIYPSYHTFKGDKLPIPAQLELELEGLADMSMDISYTSESRADGFRFEATHDEETFGVIYVDEEPRMIACRPRTLT